MVPHGLTLKPQVSQLNSLKSCLLPIQVDHDRLSSQILSSWLTRMTQPLLLPLFKVLNQSMRCKLRSLSPGGVLRDISDSQFWTLLILYTFVKHCWRSVYTKAAGVQKGSKELVSSITTLSFVPSVSEKSVPISWYAGQWFWKDIFEMLQPLLHRS